MITTSTRRAYPLLREPRLDAYGFAYSERHLQCVWSDARWRPPVLHTQDGEDVLVENPGRWNLESGPDFLDAILAVGPERRLRRGDVEIHVSPGDWARHGHARDPRYARVVAHVSYLPGTVSAQDLPAGVLQIGLRPDLDARPGFSFECLDVTAYPYAAIRTDQPPCARILQTWSPDARRDLLEAAGQERLARKTTRMKTAIEARGAEQALYEELLGALGYKHNRLPFRRLAKAVPLDAVRAEAGADVSAGYALLLGVSGLLPTRPSSRWDAETRRMIRRLWDRWWKVRSQWEARILPRHAWQLSGLRPQNHPIRRLAAAAALFVPGQDLIDRIMATDDATPPAAWTKAVAARLIDSAQMPYWRHRLSFGGARQDRPTALLGQARVGAMLSNVIVPFLAATGHAVTPLLPFLPAEEDSGPVRRTATALLGRDHNAAECRTGLRQQGLLQIFHDFCLNDKSGCANCGLAAELRGSSIAPGGAHSVCASFGPALPLS